MKLLTFTAAQNDAVAAARSVPDLIAKLCVVSPALAAQIGGKGLIMSRSPWGTLVVAAVGYLAARFGFGWSPDVVGFVSAMFLLGGAFLMRQLTSTPITGVLAPAPILRDAVTADTPAGASMARATEEALRAAKLCLVGGLALAGLAGCADQHVAAQAGYAVVGLYDVTAESEAAFDGRLSQADLRTLQRLDNTAYSAVAAIRTGGMTGSYTPVELAAAQAATNALVDFIASKKG